MINQIIIIGGGSSINSLIDKGLWNKLTNTFTIGTNFSYRDYIPTILCALDKRFLTGEIIPVRGYIRGVYDIDYDHLNNLQNIPTIYTHIANKTHKTASKNVYFFKVASTYQAMKNDQKSGFYTHSLTGQWALSIAANILQYTGDIFLLGFDANKSGNTHYYKHTIHSGLNNNRYYADKNNDLNKILLPYTQESNLHIYNISEISEITIFPKITANEFFNKIIPINITQTELRERAYKILT